MTPQKTKDGKPYGPIRYKQIVKECYYITKNTSTSYTEALELSPTEREYLITFLVDEVKKSQEALEKAKEKANAKKR